MMGALLGLLGSALGPAIANWTTPDQPEHKPERPRPQFQAPQAAPSAFLSQPALATPQQAPLPPVQLRALERMQAMRSKRRNDGLGYGA